MLSSLASPTPSAAPELYTPRDLADYPLVPFLAAHPFPSLLLSLPDPSEFPTSAPLLPVWANPAGMLEDEDAYAGPSSSSALPRSLEDTILGRMDQYSLATLQGLVARTARKLASETGGAHSLSPASSASNMKRRRSEMDPEGPNGLDVVYCQLSAGAHESAFKPTLIPVTPTSARASSRGPSATSSSSKHTTLLVLQLCPTVHASSPHKHRPIIRTDAAPILPSGRLWGTAPTSTSMVDREMIDVGLGVSMGDDGGRTPMPGMFEDADGSELFPSDSEADADPSDSDTIDESTMAVSPVEPRPEGFAAKPMKRSSFGTRELLESYDWANTSLGPKDKWPQSLLTAVSVVMGTGHESCLWWGPEFVLIYNDSYAEMSLRKHPFMFGKTSAVGWGEIWAEIEPLARSVLRGEMVHKTDDMLFFQRDVTKAPEETYHTWLFCPVEIEDGSYGGLLNASFETTSKVLAERRLEVLRDMASSSYGSKSQDEYWAAVVGSMSLNPHDIPFALLYNTEIAPLAPQPVVTTHAKPETHARVSLTLCGSIGVPDGHGSAPKALTLTVDLNQRSGSTADGFFDVDPLRRFKSSSAGPMSEHRNSIGGEGDSSVSGESGSGVTVTSLDGKKVCPWPIAEAIATRRPVFVEDCRSLVEGFDSRSWGEEPTETALVIPIADTDDPTSTKQAVLIVGLNTRRPFDQDYENWLRLLRLQLSSGLTGVISLETQIQRAEELAKLDRAKTTFFSNVSHELRTPLTLIQGPVGDLLTGEKDPSKKRMLEIATRNISRLGRIINLLMDVSRVEAGRMQGTFSPRQLGAFTADLASLFRSAIEKGKVKYTVECDTTDPRMVYVDPDLWEKIVFNIAGNAFKYCLRGSIRVFLKYHPTEIEFGVQDTGVGIPKEDIPKVIERFHRVASIGRSHEGTGIGLSLTSELIKMHGGSLTIESCTAEESENGEHGSTFTARIPLGIAHLPKDRIEEMSDPTSTQARAYEQSIVLEAENWFSTEGTTMSNSDSGSISEGSTGDSSKIDPSTLFWSKTDTILVVDDNIDMRRYLIAILSPYCTIIEASNGKEALDIAISNPPNLIITDVMMPIMDGHQLLAALRASDSAASFVPLIIITARAGEEEKVNGLLLGAEDYLPKPFGSKELVARSHLQMQMGKRRIELERKFNERTLEIQMRAEEAELKRKEAEEQRRQQELLVDVTSHEIRNPVSAILQNSGLCKENLTVLHGMLQSSLKDGKGFFPTPALMHELVEDLESLDSIIAMAQSQERIANDILSLARIQLHTLEIYPVEMNLMVEAKRILNVFASECRMKSINLTLAFGESLLGLNEIGLSTIKVDSVRLGQILINLISNSIRFTSPSPIRDIRVTVEIRKDPPQDDTCLPPPPIERPVSSPRPTEEEIYIYGAVSDTGPGLSQEALSQLFQKFRQADRSTHAVFGGSGLGLYVCRRICELMDGQIEVASRQGEGSTFRFYVKASLQKFSGDGILPGVEDLEAKPSLMDVERMDVERMVVESANKAQIERLETADEMRVLIVEDNLINQKVLKRQLVKARFAADVASDGAEALRLIKAAAEKGNRYAVVLMDLEMPVMDGLTAIKAIREMEARGELTVRQTVYALTGNARPAQIENALSSGMDSVILKPYKLDNLLSKLRALEL